MALHSAAKGKLISVIGDEVKKLYIKLLLINLIFSSILGHLCRVSFGWSRRNQQKSSPQFSSGR